MSTISELLDMVARRGPILMRTSMGNGAACHVQREAGKVKWKKCTEADHAEWQRLYVKERWSVYRLAEKWDVSNGRISHVLKRRGVKLRTQKESLKRRT